MIETEGGFWSFKFQPMSMMDEGPAPARTYRLTRHVHLHFNHAFILLLFSAVLEHGVVEHSIGLIQNLRKKIFIGYD